MGTGGGPEKQIYTEDTPEVHEIVQPLIVELSNLLDSDGLALQKSNLTQELFYVTESNDVLMDNTGNLNFVSNIKTVEINT